MANGQKRKRRAMSPTELALSNPVWLASRKDPMSVNQRLQRVLEARLSFDAIINGKCTDTDPEDLALAANLALVMCERGFGLEHIDVVKAAQEALIVAQERANAGANFNFDGPGRRAVIDLLDIYEQQLELAGHDEVMKALVIVSARIRHGDVICAGWKRPPVQLPA